MEQQGTSATVFEILQRVFPNGTREQSSPELWDAPPSWPPDVFAATAFLLERSGLYAYLTPGTQQHWNDPWFVINPSQAKRWRKAAAEWRAQPQVPETVDKLWTQLLNDGRNARFARAPRMGERMPKWVVAAVGLMIISDEACGDVGYLHPEGEIEKSSWIALLQLKAEIHNMLGASVDSIAPSGSHRTIKRHKYSITQRASADLVAVQPKSHTAQIGATLRSITQNLALLPPPSRMAATWQRVTGKYGSGESLNILLVPFPYTFDEDWLIALPSGSAKSPWGWFDIEQRWLPEDPVVLSDYVSALIVKAEAGGNRNVHVLMFPEFALNWKHYEHLTEYLAERYPHLEFVVAGSSTNCEGAEGNFALTSSISRYKDRAVIHTNSRGKHHRWRLDERQIKTYGLENKLPSIIKNWWEGIAIQRRQVHTHVFRNSSCFTTFICEDLARSDPSHETVRSLGPSIVFCLLMDGVQIPTRWSARYAEGLVEDPGSAVLTFTSRGLIQRGHDKEIATHAGRCGTDRAGGKTYPRQENWSIALWRDTKHAPIELHCPPGDHAVLLELYSEPLNEYSYDGRENTEGVSWFFKRSETVQLSLDNSALNSLETCRKIKDQRLVAPESAP